MQTSSTLETPLSPYWAFVVQLREGTALTPDALRGRVEHIVSGKATLFVSVGELLVFIANTLGSEPESPPTRGRVDRR
jgi:hypothetical protein